MTKQVNRISRTQAFQISDELRNNMTGDEIEGYQYLEEASDATIARSIGVTEVAVRTIRHERFCWLEGEKKTPGAGKKRTNERLDDLEARVIALEGAVSENETATLMPDG